MNINKQNVHFEWKILLVSYDHKREDKNLVETCIYKNIC